MKWSIFKRIIFVAFLATSVLAVRAQEVDSIVSSRYDKRVHRYREAWQNIIPTHTKLHFFGGMGVVAAGFGWDYGKHNQWETDLFMGLIPRYSSSRAKLSFTVKQNYMPWSVSLGKGFSLEPLSCGIYLNTVFGDEFWVEDPERYPDGYYNIPTKLRTNAFIGQRWTWEVDPERRYRARAITFYYELCTSDFYLISAFGNSYLKPKDYLNVAFGIKLQLF